MTVPEQYWQYCCPKTSVKFYTAEPRVAVKNSIGMLQEFTGSRHKYGAGADNALDYDGISRLKAARQWIGEGGRICHCCRVAFFTWSLRGVVATEAGAAIGLDQHVHRHRRAYSLPRVAAAVADAHGRAASSPWTETATQLPSQHAQALVGLYLLVEPVQCVLDFGTRLLHMEIICRRSRAQQMLRVSDQLLGNVAAHAHALCLACSAARHIARSHFHMPCARSCNSSYIQRCPSG